MFKILRIICTILSAAAVAACVFVFVYLGISWGILTLLIAVAFFMLMLVFKRLQENGEERDASGNDYFKSEPSENQSAEEQMPEEGSASDKDDNTKD